MATTIRPETAPAKPEPGDKTSPAIADPGPLGLAAFAMTTFVLSVFNANIIGLAVESRQFRGHFHYAAFGAQLSNWRS